MAAGFGNDFNPALDQPALFPLLFESLEGRVIQYVANALDCLDNIRQSWRKDPVDHQNTRTADSSICFFRRGCRLLRVMMSVLRPRILAARSFTSISSN